jgi:hypothetical protein
VDHTVRGSRRARVPIERSANEGKGPTLARALRAARAQAPPPQGAEIQYSDKAELQQRHLIPAEARSAKYALAFRKLCHFHNS